MKVIFGKFYRAIWILGIAALTLYYVVALKNIWDQMAPAPPQQEGKKSYSFFFWWNYLYNIILNLVFTEYLLNIITLSFFRRSGASVKENDNTGEPLFYSWSIV